ncbi:MAG: CocE/NonD family hydrolase [Thermotogae bacterium]|nr:CocE/NonD family hydrolase [Thermotogota bacterium]
MIFAIFGYLHFKDNVIASDGETLKVYVYLPDSAVSDTDTVALPVVLVRTPYDTLGVGAAYISYITSLGYAYVVSTFRGYWGSSGVRLPFLAEGWGPLHDGLDVVLWIEDREWSNGQICTAGGSALGFAQYFLGGTSYPITCMAPAVAGISMYHEVFYGGVFRKFIAEYWLNGVGATHMLDTIERYYVYSDTTPWAWVNGYSRPTSYLAPMLHLTGWFDAFTEGAIGAFRTLQYHGGGYARGNQYLVIGPWMHDLSERTVGDITFPPNANAISVPAYVINWILYWTGNGGWDWDTMPHVLFYLMGDVSTPDTHLFNRWIEADSFPPPGGSEMRFYLHADSSLQTDTTLPTTLTYTYDPNDPLPSLGGFDYIGGGIRDSILFGPRDLRSWHLRSDLLIFTSNTLEEPLAIVGQPYVEMDVVSDRYDTDFMVFLADVYPDGRSILITEGALRMRNRNGIDREELITPGDTYRITVPMRNTAYVFNSGHRIRLYISSSKFPSYEPNPNTGAPFQRDDPVKLTAHNGVRLGSSALALPVYDLSLLLKEDAPPKPRPRCKIVQGKITCEGANILGIYDVAGRRLSGPHRGVLFVLTDMGTFKLLVR